MIPASPIRTVPYIDVWRGVVTRHGLDPHGDQVTMDARRAIARAITRSTRAAWRYWDWPDLTLTEQRAFRIVWNATRQFHKVNANGAPDEVFYLGAPPFPTEGPNTNFGTGVGYYQVLSTAPSDPPIGNVPTDTTYWQPLDRWGSFIDKDQPCRHSIGDVLAVFRGNPEFDGHGHRSLDFTPSQSGIRILSGHHHHPGLTVFVWFRIEPPRFTMVPFAAGRHFHGGDLTFWPGTGECYQALDDNTVAPPDPNHWIVQPMPDRLAPAIEALAYAATAKENDAGLTSSRYKTAQDAALEGFGWLEQEADQLQAEGQQHHWNKHWHMSRGGKARRRHRAIDWAGGPISLLSDVCVGAPAPAPAEEPPAQEPPTEIST